MKLLGGRIGNALVALAAVAIVSSISYPIYKTYEVEMRIALGMEPPPEVLDIDMGKYHVQFRHRFLCDGNVRIRGPKTNWYDEGRGGYELCDFTVQPVFEFESGYRWPQPQAPGGPVWAMDMNKDGYDEFIVTSYSGGNAGTYHIWIMSARESMKVLFTVVADSEPSITDENGDGVMEMSVLDGGFVDWNECHAGSPMPMATYAWKNGKYVLSTPRFYARHAAEIERKMQAFPQAIETARAAWGFDDKYEQVSAAGEILPPTELWDIMLDCIYFGEGNKAWEVCDQLWPAENPGKARFLIAFDRQLRTACRFWHETDNATAPEKRWPGVKDGQ